MVDCLDALASDRPYRRAIPLCDAVARIEAEAGTAFDPAVVSVLKARYQHYESTLKRNGARLNLSALSHETRVERGESPATGFETSSPRRRTSSKEGTTDFLSSIAGARQEAQTLFELAQSLGNSLSLQDTLSMMAARVARLIEYDALAVYVIDEGVLKPAYVVGVDSRFLSSLAIPIGQGLSGWVAENQTPILNGTPAVEAGYMNDVRVLSNLNSALAVPLTSQERVVGVVSLYSLDRDHFSRDEVRVLQAVASKLTMSIENARRFEQAESSATIDYLTGLPNARALFLRLDEEINRCGRSNESLAVLVCDLDNFKQVNDRFGHLAGNDVLKGVATEVQNRLRKYDYVARMGGDEFVILMPNVPTARLAAKVEELNAITMAACRAVCGQELISISCGVAMLGEDGLRAEDLLGAADRRMYENKTGDRQARSLVSLAKTHNTVSRLQTVN